MDIIEIKAQLADINQRLMGVASRQPDGSDVQELASAIHNLSAVVAEVADQTFSLPADPAPTIAVEPEIANGDPPLTTA